MHSNCLTRHAAVLNGEVGVGLGDASRDFTTDPTQAAEPVGFRLQFYLHIVILRRWLGHERR